MVCRFHGGGRQWLSNGGRAATLVHDQRERFSSRDGGRGAPLWSLQMPAAALGCVVVEFVLLMEAERWV